MSDRDIPEPTVETSRWKRVSWVWIMPLIAVVMSAAVVWQTYRNQGPVIVVSFPIASGIEAGETPLRFRDVQVGLVEEIRFSPGFEAVEAHIRVDNSVADFVDADAAFWLVEPRISARGITGLQTVLSGVFIEGIWDGEAGTPQDRFDALERTPLTRPGQEGTQVVLRMSGGGQFSAGAPIMFNGIEVGRIGEPELNERGSGVTVEAFIEAPHDARLTTATRFWDISGVSVDLGLSGLSVRFDSLATLIEGGVGFGTLVTGGEAIDDGHMFEVHDGPEAAQLSVFEDPFARELPLAVLLTSDDLRLPVGAVVRFRGLQVGAVTSITGYTNPRAPDKGVQLLVQFEIAPARIGLAEGLDRADLLEVLARRVEGGLRPRIASEGLLGTRLILELIEEERWAGGELITDLLDVPLLPPAPASATGMTANIDGVLNRIMSLPIEDLMTSGIDALDSVTALVSETDIRELTANLNGLVSDARTLVSTAEIETTLADVSSAAAALEGFMSELSGSEGLGTAFEALEDSDEILANVRAFSERLPALAGAVEGLLDGLQEVPVQSLAASADRVLLRIDTILASEGAEALPETLNASLGELAAVLAALREGGAAESLVSTLGSAETAFAAIEGAAGQFPAIATRLEGLVASLQGLTDDYDDSSAVYREVRGAIDGIAQAADAFRSLARAIERNPNSLITGR